jgi:acetyl esterase
MVCGRRGGPAARSMLSPPTRLLPVTAPLEHPPADPPAMAGLLDRIRRAQRPPLHALTPAEARAAYDSRRRGAGPAARRCPGAGPDSARRRRPRHCRPGCTPPSHDRLPVLLYLHGGGFVIGGLETHDSLCRQLALRSGGAVLALDYRLAPEHRFPPPSTTPGPHCTGWPAPAPHALGLDGRRWPWAATAPAARWPRWRPACPRHRPAAGAAAADHAGHRGPPTRLAPAVRQRLPAGRGHHRLVLRPLHRPPPPRDWRFAPLLADEVDGVAPACVLLAECDPLVDEGLAYADRLRGRRAGGTGAGAAA